MPFLQVRLGLAIKQRRCNQRIASLVFFPLTLMLLSAYVHLRLDKPVDKPDPIVSQAVQKTSTSFGCGGPQADLRLRFIPAQPHKSCAVRRGMSRSGQSVVGACKQPATPASSLGGCGGADSLLE